MRMFITSKNKYLSNDMKIFGTCSIPLIHSITLDEHNLLYGPIHEWAHHSGKLSW